MLVGARQLEDLSAQKPMPPRDGITLEHGVGMADVGRVVDVEDRGRQEIERNRIKLPAPSTSKRHTPHPLGSLAPPIHTCEYRPLFISSSSSYGIILNNLTAFGDHLFGAGMVSTST